MMRKHLRISIGFVALICAAYAVPMAMADDPAPSKEGIEFFEKKIRPVLVDSCYKCHSASAKKVKGKLKLDSWEAIAKGGESGKASVVPGDPDKSLLIVAIRYTDKDSGDHDALLMPPPKDDQPKKLPDAVIKDFEDWVKMGRLIRRTGPRRNPSRPHPSTRTSIGLFESR